MSPDNSVTWGNETDFYSENGISYDLNGNILSLNRNQEYFSNGATTADQIDKLNYYYERVAAISFSMYRTIPPAPINSLALKTEVQTLLRALIIPTMPTAI